MASRRDQCRHIVVCPADVREARRLLESLGFVVEAHAGLLELGALLAAWHPKKRLGLLLDAIEVTALARHGREALNSGFVRGWVATRVPEDAEFYHIRRYAESALAEIIARFHQEAVPGNRNNALNAAAYALGRLVGGNILHEGEALQALMEAANAVFSDDEDDEVSRTIESGMEAGMENPAVPPLKRAGGAGERPEWAKPRAPKRPLWTGR